MAGQSAGANPLTGPVSDLGLGSNLAQQQKDETEEERRKRLLGLSPLSSLMPGVTSLFGQGGAGGRGF